MSATAEPLALLHDFVDVDRAPVQPPGERPGHRRLARRHEADEVNLIRFHVLRLRSGHPQRAVPRARPGRPSARRRVQGRRQPDQCLEKARVGNHDDVRAVNRRWARRRRAPRWRTPSPSDGRRARRRRRRLSAAPTRPATTKPSGRSSASRPIARNPATSVAMRSLSLTRNSAAPLTVTLAAVGAERRDCGQFVDQAWNFVGPDLDRVGRGRGRRIPCPAARRRPSRSSPHRPARRTGGARRAARFASG